MYKRIIRPLLFLINPEKVHHFVVALIKLSFQLPGIRKLINAIFTVNHPALHRDFAGLHFTSPVGLAAGFDKNAEFFNEFSNFGFGYIEVGTVTPQPQIGNPKPRMFRLPKNNALINRMGFNNKGVETIKKNLQNRTTNIIIGANLGKNTNTPNTQAVNDFIECFNGLYDVVDYFVVNVSCPNITNNTALQDKENLLIILNGILNERKKHTIVKPVLLKLSPDLNNDQLDDVINIVQTVKIEGLVVGNTTIKRDGLAYNAKQLNEIGNGGLSGSPLTDRSTDMIRYISNKTNGTIPIIGVGGILTVDNALEKLEAGATLIQVYTGFIYEGPAFVKRINKAIIKQYNKMK